MQRLISRRIAPRAALPQPIAASHLGRCAHNPSLHRTGVPTGPEWGRRTVRWDL